MSQVTEMIWREDDGIALKVPLYTESKHNKVDRIITLEELSKHDKPGDCWFCIHGRVYDASKFQINHPGGWLPMKAMAGKKDASDAFEAFHPARVHVALLPSMFIGTLEVDKNEDKKEEDKLELAMRNIRQELLSRNLFQTEPNYYITKLMSYLPLFILAITLTLSKTYYIAGACIMGIFWQQVAFIGHDVGHNAITHKRSMDYFWGVLFGNAVMGISLGWWKQSHNVHHVVCNSVEHDPDIQHLPFFAVSDKIFNQGGFDSTYHKKRFDLDFFARFLVSIQHFLFYPVMAVARINLYAQSWINLIEQKHGPVPYRDVEIFTLTVFIAWVGLLMTALDTNQERFYWIAISHAVSGLLHVQICISHFPMDAYREHELTRKFGWFRLQLATSMNVATPVFLDWLHGGLQFQIEHHMFPRLPRHNLREARRLVRDSLAKLSMLDDYKETGFFNANLVLLKGMRNAANEVKKLRKGDGGLYISPLINGLNLEG